MIIQCQCKKCRFDAVFEQDNPYHAGFANQGFLYADSGTRTLVWSSFDPAYVALIGDKHPWGLSGIDQQKLESQLLLAPDGGAWRFENPARCPQCAQPIADSILSTIYYLVYQGSVICDAGPRHRSFRDALRESMDNRPD